MIYILLCGGIGSRNNNYSLPKPLNYIEGKHMIEYNIERIPSKEIYIIYNKVLQNYNFEEIIINKFKTHVFHFCKLDYLTRGPVETALIGINNFNISSKQSCIFIDNDNVHSQYPKDNYEHSFIGYNIDFTRTNYSFIKFTDDKVIEIKEKDKISDYFCCGLYGFSNKDLFIKYATMLLDLNIKSKNEYYFSTLYGLMINKNEHIIPIKIENTYHFGSIDEIQNNVGNVKNNTQLRVCFDLDNTLVTYPEVPYDYSTVKPIKKNIKLLCDLKAKGHEIIIHTARRMKTHNHNVGKVIKDIALVTINTLNDLEIPYDELLFGKPIADIYIDDRSINPYINNINFFGVFLNDSENIGELSLNKNTTIYKQDDTVIKTGLYSILKGELYYYQNIPQDYLQYFCTFIDYSKTNENLCFKLKYENGIPLTYIYKNKLLTEQLFVNLLNVVDCLHRYENHELTITEEDIMDSYVNKLEVRRKTYSNEYDFDKDGELLNDIITNLKKHFSPKIVKLIHGDLWFSNIILNYNDEFKLLDMKGEINNKLTLSGDAYYDYGKIYQSILGLDMIVHGYNIDLDYLAKMRSMFIIHMKRLGLNIPYLNYVTKSLIYGIFWCLPTINYDKKIQIINLIKSI